MDSKNDDAPAADTGTLDLQLTYLWRVHGVDYYAGRELADPMQFKLRLDGKRMLRGPRPEEGEQAPQAEGGSLRNGSMLVLSSILTSNYCLLAMKTLATNMTSI